MGVTMKVGAIVTAICTGLILTACGSSETKTVTETVEASAPAEAEVATPTEGTEGALPTKLTIPDGTWAKGEYTPGTYRSPGGETCSWQQNELPGGEKEGEGFNENYGIGETNIMIQINSPYFKTEDCGLWEKVGE